MEEKRVGREERWKKEAAGIVDRGRDVVNNDRYNHINMKGACHGKEHNDEGCC